MRAIALTLPSTGQAAAVMPPPSHVAVESTAKSVVRPVAVGAMGDTELDMSDIPNDSFMEGAAGCSSCFG